MGYHALAFPIQNTIDTLRLMQQLLFETSGENRILRYVLCTSIQGSPADIVTPTHPNVIDCVMTAPPPVLSPSSILLLTLPRVFSFQQ